VISFPDWLFFAILLFMPFGLFLFVLAFLWGWRRIGKIAALLVIVAASWYLVTGYFLRFHWGGALSLLFAALVTFGAYRLWDFVDGKWPGLMARKAPVWRWAMGLTFLACLAAITIEMNRTQIYHIFASPKGRYYLIVEGPDGNLINRAYYHALSFLTPWRNGLNIPATVRLYDSNGKFYAKAKVPSLNDMVSPENVSWADDEHAVWTIGGANEFLFKMPKE
jgi:hypothetical protein